MVDKTFLYRFFEGNLSSQEELELFDWLEQDPNHREEFIRERKKYDSQIVFGYEENLIVDIDKEYQKVKLHIETEKKKRQDNQRQHDRSKRIHLLRQISKYAAVLLLGYLIWYFLPDNTQKRQEETQISEMQTVRSQEKIPSKRLRKTLNKGILTVATSKGNKQSLRLPDSSLVWLNADTELKYAQSFLGKTREVWLNGEAYFEVTHDAQRQFIVHTNTLDVKVYGTSFNVYAYNNELKKSFTLVEGSIKLELNNEKKELLQLLPGQKAIYDSGEMGVQQINPTTETSWKEGKFYFNSKPFAEICRQLERNFNVTILIEGESLKSLKFTGQFLNNESLEEILSVISHDQRIAFKTDQNQIIIQENK